MLLQDRIILVTGASSGIGLAALGVFAAEGATVIGLARRAGEALAEVQRLQSAGHRVRFMTADITKGEEVSRVIADI